MLENPEYLEYMMPLMRADLAVLETYRFPERAPLTCPVVALGGEDDMVCLPDELVRWGEVTTGRFTRRTFPGGHFYLFDAREPFLSFLRETFESLVG
jgi:surfactin synthase thioesterase subunit